ncbi:Na(+)-translocating NADH-quinone reductase subunit F [Psychroflexus montanilacus]|uniref:Na(+)-translocating NADH-quinone reductase subunit F n=1 Tax=Psychroflexus montanilacus TaxID=2873598 RepID=UPI001CCA0593|nr:Na(+)-translocating NADH-quinone reductase subunit F [Psychroflexus montanilacus]MBZ9651330.1 Na(+)-translocating NADH-quinone reductase subunit F [Psychroflexus montanilacus]
MGLLSEQQLHNLAMNVVGKDLEDMGYEFLAVNSKKSKNPQFVATKDKKLIFVVVRAVKYPENPVLYDEELMQKVSKHGVNFKAKTFYAGVGIANSISYELPVDSEEDYVLNYSGLIEIK